MKRIPAGILLATLFFALPLVPRSLAEESAEDLANQTLGSEASTQDQSAEDLAKQNGVAIDPSTDPDESAQELAKQNGVAIDPNDNPNESAQALAKKNGVAIPAGQDNEGSAEQLAEQRGLEKKPKIVASPSQSVFSGGEGVDGSVYAAASLPDGSIVIGGRFTSVNGQPRSNLARIKADGTLDPKFFAAPNSGVTGAVYALALDASGNLLVGGYFTSVQGTSQQNFVRYLAAGAFDASFTAGQSPNGAVFAVAVQPDGKIVIGGQFSQVGDSPRRNVARFNADGTLDAPVSAANASTGSVRTVAALASGGILAGGTFEVAGGGARNLLYGK